MRATSAIWLHLHLLLLLLASCAKPEPPRRFELLEASATGVHFINSVPLDSTFNIYAYRNFYNGGGVAIADFNEDGLPDLFFTSNTGPNRLYLNLGGFVFTDVTEAAGVAGTRAWTTGASVGDVNGDGRPDLYVTSAGEEVDRRNELFIHSGYAHERAPSQTRAPSQPQENGDTDGNGNVHDDEAASDLRIPVFKEMAAAYGLDDDGMSIAATFLDIDRDGLVDLYLMNNEDKAIGSFDLSRNERHIRSKAGGDRLYRNLGGRFQDVSEQAGIHGSVIGFSLSASASDLDGDGHTDLFVANDFFERDYLYMNRGDGTFRDIFGDPQTVRSMSAASMGSDIADLDGDGLPDIYVADMLPSDERRVKSVTMFEALELVEDKMAWGYGHQITRNTLHLNRGDGTFAEVGRLAGVEASDWSWAVLIADFDLNGWNDIYVTNGLVQDITNLDYLLEISTPDMMRSIISEEQVDFKRLVDIIPSVPVPNALFSNAGQLRFKESAEEWGLAQPGFSSGAAWGDLDGDGDLDLVVNDVNSPARIYRNHTVEHDSTLSRLTIRLKGSPPNTFAVGAKVTAHAEGRTWLREHYLQRGFQSSVEPGLFFGFQHIASLDSIVVEWPDGTRQSVTDPESLRLPARITLTQP